MRKVWLLLAGVLWIGAVTALLLLNARGVKAETTQMQILFAAPEGAVAGQKDSIPLPASVSGTDLLIRRISAYEGPFPEDDSSRFVMDAVALEIVNTGQNLIAEANIVLKQGNHSLTFLLSCLPAGESLLVVEKSGAAYSDEPITEIRGEQTLREDFMEPELLQPEDLRLGLLRLTNTTNRTLTDICLYYKPTAGPESILIGGAVKRFSIHRLLPGQSALLNLPDYAMDYSRIVAIQAKKSPGS